MYSLDTNINTALDLQAERVRAVQAVGKNHMPNAAQLWAKDDAPRTWGPAGALKAGMVMAATVPVAIWVAWVLIAR